MEEIKKNISYIFVLILTVSFSCTKREKIQKFHENGNIKEEYLSIDGEKNGIYRSYFDNGNIMSTGNYLNGKKEGEFAWYSLSGVKIMSVNFLNDLEHGKYKEFRESGGLLKSVEFEKGKRHGQALKFYENGKVESKIEFNEDSLIYFETYDSLSGNLINWLMEYDIKHKRDSLKNHNIIIHLKNKKTDFMGVEMEIYSGIYTEGGEIKYNYNSLNSDIDQSQLVLVYSGDELGTEILLKGKILDIQSLGDEDLVVLNEVSFSKGLKIWSSDSSFVFDSGMN